jgi:hypothetical protein
MILLNGYFFYIKIKSSISTEKLNQEISEDKYKIIINYVKKHILFNRDTYKIENMNKNLIYYLVEHGVDINKDNMFRETPLFYACKKWK